MLCRRELCLYSYLLQFSYHTSLDTHMLATTTVFANLSAAGFFGFLSRHLRVVIKITTVQERIFLAVFRPTNGRRFCVLFVSPLFFCPWTLVDFCMCNWINCDDMK